jgi:uncharacterized protein YdcH (DUF465 family)
MKMPVSWHKERLANMGLSMEYILRQVEQLQCTLQRLADEHAVLREQIKRAEAEGRDGFDQEKFNIKRATQ